MYQIGLAARCVNTKHCVNTCVVFCVNPFLAHVPYTDKERPPSAPSPSPLRPHRSPHPLGRLATAPGQIHATLGCHRRRAHAPARAFRRRPTRPWPAQAVVQSLRRHRGSPPPVPTASQLTARTARGIADGPAEGAWGVARPVRPRSPHPTKLHACRTTFFTSRWSSARKCRSARSH